MPAAGSLRKNGLFWSFPNVGPEPVLVKIIVFAHIDGSKRPFLLTVILHAIPDVNKARAWYWLALAAIEQLAVALHPASLTRRHVPVGRRNQTVARILNWNQSGIAAPLVQSPVQQAIETERPHQPKQRSVVDQRIIQPPVTHARTKPSEKQQYDIIICHSATRVACHYEEERLLLCCSRTSLRMACKAALRCRSTLPSLEEKR